MLKDNKDIIHIGIHEGTNVGDVAISRVINELAKKCSLNLTKLPFNAKEYTGWCRIIKLIKMAYYDYSIGKSHGKAIIGGGNLLMGTDIVFPIQLLLHCLSLRLSGCTITVYSVGVGPFSHKLYEFIVRLSLTLCDRVICRDIESSKLLTKFDVKHDVLEDPVFSYSELFENVESKSNYDISISVMAIGSKRLFPELGSSEREDIFLRGFIRIIEGLLCNGIKVLLFVTDEEKDFNFLKKIKENLPQDVDAVVAKTPNEIASIVSSSRMVLATRMHSAIFAISYGRPVLCFEWQHKIRGMYKDLEKEEWLISLTAEYLIEGDAIKKIIKLYDTLHEYEGWVIDMKDRNKLIFQKHLGVLSAL